MIKLHFPIEPVPKGRPRVNRWGVVYTPIKTRRFEKALKVMAVAEYKGEIKEGPLAASIKCYLKKPKSVKREWPSVKPDGDNLIKAIFDALNGIVWKDDAQIIECVFQKFYSMGEGWIDVEVHEVQTSPTQEVHRGP